MSGFKKFPFYLNFKNVLHCKWSCETFEQVFLLLVVFKA